MNEDSEVTKNFLVYLEAIKSGLNENVFFDFSFYNPTLERDFLNFSLENSDFCGTFGCFLEEIRIVCNTTKDFLRFIVKKLEQESSLEIITNPTDWAKVENMGKFLEKLYQHKVIKMRGFFNLWMETNKDEQNGQRLFLQTFQSIHQDIKKRDLVLFEKFLKMVKTINNQNTTEPQIKSIAKQIIASQRECITKTCEQLMKEIRAGNLLIFDLNVISFDGKELANAFFREVSSVPGSVESFIKAANLMNSFNERNEDIVEFFVEINENCLRFSTELGEISDDIIRFVAQLYNTAILSTATMETILKNMSSKDQKINSHVKEIISFIKDKSTENSKIKKMSAVDKMIKEFEKKFGEVVALDPIQKFMIPPLKDPSNTIFIDIIQKVLSDQLTGEVYQQILESESPDFFEYFVESAMKNSQKAGNFALVCKEIRSKTFKRACITQIQQKFEENLKTQNQNEELGINKFIGELFNIDVLTARLIHGIVIQLENSPISSSDVLLETIARKVIVDQSNREDIANLKNHVKKFLIKLSLSKK